MGSFIKRYEIWVFLILAPIINVFFVQARIEGLMSKTVFNTGRFCILLFMLICILRFTRGNKGIINLFKPMLNWKVHPKWYILSLTFTISITFITLILKSFYYDVDYHSFITFRSTTLRGYIALIVWAFLGEVVWVSYCIRELSKITKPFYAGLIVGVFWTLWFIPIILNNEGIFPQLPILPFFIRILGVAGMCAFIYKNTKSGICVLVLQTMSNFTTVSFPIMPLNGGKPTYTVFAVIGFLMMLSFWFFSYLLNKRKQQVMIKNTL